MSKLPPIAPGQLTVIFFPLIALHHSSRYKLPTGGSSGYCLHRSGNHPQLQRVHCGLHNQSVDWGNCNSNGNGATARRNRRGNGDGGNRSIAIATATAIAVAPGQQDSDCNGAMRQRSIVFYIAAQNVETGQRRRRRSIDCNGNGAKGLGQLQLQWHWGTGAGATGQ
jgi:hypothetical protein